MRSRGPIKKARLASLSLTVALGGAMVAPTLFAAQAVVPGENGKIVFTSCRTGASEIWVMNADGSDQKQLTFDGAKPDPKPSDDRDEPCADSGSREPVWSPDGTKIAFTSYMNGTVGSSSDLFIMNADGTGRTNLTKFSGFDDEPAWSPDGTKIAWRSNRSDNNDAETWVMNADGTNPVQLTSHSGVDDEPAWSPDGTKIAIRRCAPGKGAGCALAVINAANGESILDMENAPGFPTGAPSMDDPAWSTDGTLLAFRSSGINAAPDIITVKAADGTAKTNLSNDPDSNVDPAYSPDGAKVAYVRQVKDMVERSDNGDIWVMNADGTGQVQLTTDPGFDGDPDYQTLSGTTVTTAPTTDTTAPTQTTVPTTGTTVTTTPGTVTKSGYWLLESGGKVHPFGDAATLADVTPSAETVDLEAPSPTAGYSILQGDGRVHTVGGAKDLGSATTLRAGEKATSLSATPTGNGFWVFTNKGRALPFGDATSYGDMSGTALNGDVLDSVPTATGKGYYMVGSDGGIFAFGDAVFHGSMGDKRLNAPVQSLVPDPDGTGYWLVASDGGIFAFKSDFRGSMGDKKLNKPVTGMVTYGNGYMMVAEDGGVFNFSNKPFSGSLGNTKLAKPVVAVAAIPAK